MSDATAPSHSAAGAASFDLRDRVAGHSLIEQLLEQWDRGRIRLDPMTEAIVVDEGAINWYRGVHGERRVAHELALLGPDWTVLHSVPVGTGQTDIDHVVIGPTGVYTINTKYHPGKSVWVAGGNLNVERNRTEYIRKALFEASRATTKLARVLDGASVTPVLVFVDPSHITIKEASPVRVVSCADLTSAFAATSILSSDRVAKIVDAACRAETWHDAPAATSPGRHLEREFAALESEVGPALAAPWVRSATPTSAPQKRWTPSPTMRAQSVPRAARVSRYRPARVSSPFAPRSRPTSKRRPRRQRSGIVAPVLGLLALWWVGSNWTSISSTLMSAFTP